MRSHLQLKAWILLVIFLAQIFSPTHMLFAGSGPSQPEMASFTPAGTTEMVNPFTGDFQYNIPLMDIEGYPINIAYNSGVTMEQEASWVGLGWNLNVGTINRSVRGLPDDFKGDQIETKVNMKDMVITKIGAGAGSELLGRESLLNPSLSGGLTFIHNNYKGYGISLENSISAGLGGNGMGVKANIGFDFNSLDGTSVNSSLGVSVAKNNKDGSSMSFGGKMGTGYSTRTGQSMISLGTTAGYKGSSTIKKKDETGNFVSEDINYGIESSLAKATFLPIGMETYTPYPSVRLQTNTIDFSASAGGEAWTLHVNGRIHGSRTVQEIKDNTYNTSAYGYLYSENASYRDLKDFNRDKSVQPNKTTTHLSPVNFTYDVYSVSGQGVSGMFRPFRNDIGVLNDPQYTYKSSSSQSYGAELGLGAYAHGGINHNEVSVFSSYGPWTQGNGANNLGFKENEVGDIKENVYFKAAGETTQSDREFFNNTGGIEPIAFTLNGDKTSSTLKVGGGGSISSLPEKHQNYRAKRGKTFSFLTAAEARYAALEDTIFSHEWNHVSGLFEKHTNIQRVDGQVRKPHHLSEITQINPNGERYIYGIPVYNIEKKEVSFTTDQKSADGSIGDNKMPFNNEEPSLTNPAGIDGHYSSNKTPAYAHSFLLTAKQSADYQDVTGDGVSSDDIGNAYNFSYQRTSEDFKWRVPYERAFNFMEGFKSDEFDQKGSYSYGQKELWYLHTVKSKNQVAEFYISPREDGLGVKNEEGGRPIPPVNSDNKQYKLDSILLFSKYDRAFNKEQATPIQKVEFTYDYSLCKKVPNQLDTDSGKLTLKKIEISYGKSEQGKKSPYVFTYSDFNPDYDGDHIDRWGNYKKRSVNPSNMNNSDFPYVVQDTSVSNYDPDGWANAWSLTGIKTPYGGEVEVEYEADDYAYVQDKRAMQMFPVIGAGETSDFTASNRLYDKRYLYIEKPEWLASDAPDFIIRRLLLGESGKLDHLYFKFLTEIVDGTNEYSPGYTKALNAGICPNDTNAIFIEIPDQSPSPISIASWGFFRQNLFNILYEQPNIGDSGLESILRGIKANFGEIAQMFNGVEDHLRRKNVADEFVLNKSFIRLNNPAKAKIGGGSRVKQIVMHDAWNSLSGEGENSSYGQEYDYTTEDSRGNVISSGVASYEPLIGNDENPFRIPAPYIAQAAAGHIPAIEAYQEKPFGETFFPSAVVGYSKVTVKNIHHAKGKTAKGITEHDFYTAKDFPVIVRDMDIQSNYSPATGPNFNFPFSNIEKHTTYAASQGYSIILNDMHGKPKSKINYSLEEVDDGGFTTLVKKKLGGTNYKFRSKVVPEGMMLDNKVDYIASDGTVMQDALLGVESEIAVDSRRTYESNTSNSTQVNGEIIPMPPFGFPFPLLFGYNNYLRNINESRTVAVTKVVQMYGLLESVEKFTDQYSSTSYNRLYDGITGEVLLTETIDEHNQNEFDFTIPAHQVNGQERMGAASENINYETAIEKETDSTCIREVQTYVNPGFLKHGDEVLIYPNQKKLFDSAVNVGGAVKPYKAWVDIGAETGNGKDPFYDNLCGNEYQLSVNTRFDFSFCKDSSLVNPSNNNYDAHHLIFYHLKDSIADFINNWTASKIDDSTYQGIFGDTSANSLCNRFGTDDLGNPTALGSSLSGYDTIPGFDTLDIDELFELEDTLYLRRGGHISTNTFAASHCHAGEISSTAFNEYFYKPLGDYLVSHPSNGSTSLTVPDGSSGQSGTIGAINVLQNYHPRFNKYLQFNQLFLVERIEFYEDSLGYDLDSVVNKSYNIEWISPCSSLPYFVNPRPNDTAKPIPNRFYSVINTSQGYKPGDLSYDGYFPTIGLADDCPHTYRLMDRKGNYINDLDSIDTLQVIRSGNRNMLTADAGKVKSANYPVEIDYFTGMKYKGVKTSEEVELLQASSQTYSDDIQVRNQNQYYLHPNLQNTITNKFLLGQDACFRPDSSFRFISSRSQTSSIESRKDGYFEELPSLWKKGNLICNPQLGKVEHEIISGQSSGWHLLKSYEAYSANGVPIESTDNLGIPSTSIVNYQNNIEVVASNTDASNVIIDNYENYSGFGTRTSFPKNFFRSIESDTALIPLDNNPDEFLAEIRFEAEDTVRGGDLFYGIAHTGNYSMLLRYRNPGFNTSLIYSESPLNRLENSVIGEKQQITLDTLNLNLIGTVQPNNQLEFLSNMTNTNPSGVLISKNTYIHNDDHLKPRYYNQFKLNDPSQEYHSQLDSGTYVFSVWVKEVLPSTKSYYMDGRGQYQNLRTRVEINTVTDSVELEMQNEVIDGWRKIEGTFHYDGQHPITVRMVSGLWGVFFDDLRIHPVKSNLNTFVYDQYSGRLKAKLDANNYATFFEYNEEGIPSQVKRETDQGIITISESRQAISKKAP